MTKIEQLDKVRKGAKLEYKGNKIAYDKIMIGIRGLNKKINNQKQEREKRMVILNKYETVEEVQDAYGYGEITKDEYYELLTKLEYAEFYINNDVTPENIALDILNEFANRLSSDIHTLRIESMTNKERERYNKDLQDTADRQKERHQKLKRGVNPLDC